MKRIQFNIPIIPKPLERARTDRIRTKTGKTITVTHKSKRQKIAEEQIMVFLSRYKPADLITGQIELGVKVFYPIPKSWPKYKQENAVYGLIRPTGKPDLDNLIKQITDRMNGLFFRDDSQIVEYATGTGKYYGENPRWEILIKW